MSYEASLASHYAQIHKRLLKPPPKKELDIHRSSYPVLVLSPQIVPVSPIPLTREPRRVSPTQLLDYLCETEKVGTKDLLGVYRGSQIALVRQVFYYLARRYTELSYLKIAAFINRDHTTVISGVRRIGRLMAAMPWWQDYMDNHFNQIERIYPLNPQTCALCGQTLPHRR